MTFRDFLERYGVTLGIVVVLAIILAALPGNAPDRTASELASGSGTSAAELSEGSTVTGGANGGLTAGGGASAGGTSVAGGALTPGGAVGAAKVIFGEGDCRSDKRENAISIYAPPCLRYEGSNGGSTARGVAPDKVIVVRWMGQVDAATQAILESYKLADDPAVRKRSYDALRRYGNQHLITYGREVTFKDLPASGPSEDDRAMRADAIRIAEDIKAFAVIEGTPDALIPKVLAQELARRGVVCMCTSSLTSDFYKENPPYIFGTGLPTATEYAVNIGEFVGKRLAGKNAQWAGPLSNYRSQKRKFGLLFLEGVRDRVEPEGKRYADQIKAELAKYGVQLAASQGYLYDPGRNQNDVSTVIARFKQAGVTTIIAMWDPLSPILITREATRQQWFPEWFVTGSGLSDTTTAGRLYDGQQWSNAFGMSPLFITWANVRNSGGYRAFHHGMPGMRPGDEGVLVNIYAALVGPLFIGIHLAGPILTADSFSQGMFKFPPTGGKPAAPLVFFTRAAPTAAKDFTEVWFDANRSGPDERGEQGTGMMVKASNGKSYRPGEWPRTNPKAFVEDGMEATVSDDPSLSGDFPHERDGHTHTGPCKTCPGFATKK
ncbi:MAG: hypothetical protein ACRDKJ_08605 [Actinomycetota bacterium]